jgi:hypothetical protein
MEEVKINRHFVEELIYENIRLVEKYISIVLENNRLREELKEFKALERWWRGEDRKKLGGGYVN